MLGSDWRVRVGRKAALLFMAFGIALGVVPGHASDAGIFCNRLMPPQAIRAQGATSQLPLHYSLWLPAYTKRCRRAVGTIDYRGTSDVAGAAALSARPPEAAFIGRDVALAPDEKVLVEEGIGKILPPYFVSRVHQIPMYVTGLAVAYNLDCGKQPVRLSAQTLGLVFAGAIRTWNDESILRDNPGNTALAACTRTIHVAVRSDGAGASLIFKDYLGKKLPFWKAFQQPALVTAWPASLNVSCKGYGDAGVGGCVIARRGTIGYVGITVANRMRLKTAAVENAAGSYERPSMAGCRTAAANAATPPTTTGDWSSTTLTYPPSGYPICSFGFVDIFQDFGGAHGSANLPQEAVRNARDYLFWSLSGAVQAALPRYGYASLPPSVLQLARDGVADIHWNCRGNCSAA